MEEVKLNLSYFLQRRLEKDQSIWYRLLTGTFWKTKTWRNGLEVHAETSRRWDLKTLFQVKNQWLSLQWEQRNKTIKKISFSVMRSFSQNLSSIFCDQNHVFPLCWGDSRGKYSPTVIPLFNVCWFSKHDDWFDCEYMSNLHFMLWFVFVVINVRSLMHFCPNPMSRKIRTHIVAKWLCNILNSVSNFRIRYSWSTDLDCLVEGESSHF